jgi:hypothetical protein
MGLRPGTKLGNYEIVAPLGAGGMGEVLKGSFSADWAKHTLKIQT